MALREVRNRRNRRYHRFLNNLIGRTINGRYFRPFYRVLDRYQLYTLGTAYSVLSLRYPAVSHRLFLALVSAREGAGHDSDHLRSRGLSGLFLTLWISGHSLSRPATRTGKYSAGKIEPDHRSRPCYARGNSRIRTIRPDHSTIWLPSIRSAVGSSGVNFVLSNYNFYPRASVRRTYKRITGRFVSLDLGSADESRLLAVADWYFFLLVRLKLITDVSAQMGRGTAGPFQRRGDLVDAAIYCRKPGGLLLF